MQHWSLTTLRGRLISIGAKVVRHGNYPTLRIAEVAALRGLFLIDKEGIVRHAVINDLPLGRNVDEALRMLDALQFTEKHGAVCPANWKAGDEGMQPTADGVAEYLAEHAK